MVLKRKKYGKNTVCRISIKKYISYFTTEYRSNDSNLEKYLSENNFLTSDIKIYFLQPSKSIWNEKIGKNQKENQTNLLSKKEQFNQQEDYLKKINDLKIITNQLAYYSNNSEAKLLQFKIDSFLKTINSELKKNDPKFESIYFHLKKLYLFIRNRLKKINVKIIKDEEFILHLLERLGTDSVRQSEYRVLQYQMIFLFICYSKLNLKDIRTLTLEKLKNMMEEESTSLIHFKGIELLKEKIHIYETFFKVYPALGCSLNTKKISMMAYTTFSNILNIELRRILIELNLYNEGDELITISSLLNKKNSFF